MEVGIIAAVVSALVTIYSVIITAWISDLRKRTNNLEAEVRECEISRARLEEEVRQYRKTTIVGYGIGVRDEEGVLRIATANRNMTELFGWPHHELVDMPVENLVAPPFREQHIKKERQSQPEVGAIRKINFGNGVTKDGQEFSVKVGLERVQFDSRDAWAFEITQN